MTINRSTWPVSIDLQRYRLFFGMLSYLAQQGYAGITPNWKEVFDTLTVNEASAQVQELFSIGIFEQLSELQEPGMDDPGQGAKTTFVPLKYGAGMGITQEAYDDNNKGYGFDNLAAHLGESAAYTEQLEAWGYLNNHASKTMADGQVLLSTSHVIPKTLGTYANRPTTGIDLSELSVSNMWILAKQMLDPTGRKNPIQPVSLIHPAELHFTVARLFGTPRALGGNANDINVVFGNQVINKQVESVFLTSPVRVFYRTNVKGLTHILRKPLYTVPDKEAGLELIKLYAFMRFCFGCYDPRSIMGDGPGLA